jgi:hypothetical protein
MASVTLDQQGRLFLPARLARRFGPRAFDVASESNGHLFLRVTEDAHPILMTGTLGDISPVDLLSFFNMFRKTGVLRFDLEGGRKDLYFQDGEIVAALSSFEQENLGEILFTLGKVERDSLDRLGGRRENQNFLVKFLLDKNLVSPRDLWQAVRHQAETIVYHLLPFQSGSFSFQAKALEKKDPFQLSMNTQNLLMEGLRRQDERQLFMRLIPSMDCIARPGDKIPEGLGGSEQALLDMIRSGKHSVAEIVRRSGLGDFEGLRVLYHLVERGAVRVEAESSTDDAGDLGEILAVLNDGLRLIHQAACKVDPQFHQRVISLLRELPQPYSYILRDAEIEQDGVLASSRILANLAGLEEGDKRQLLVDAVGELLYLESHAAREVLGDEKAAAVVADVKKATARAGEILGRTK